MTGTEITDWDDAYANAANIPNGNDYFSAWKSDAEAFRNSWSDRDIDVAYGRRVREKLDIFHPDNEPKGLVFFIHGGYWYRFDKSYWSHFARGALDNGWAVCLPGYDLTPDVRIADITNEIGAAISAAAARVAGPLRLSGHSAGGHLVSRMVSEDTPLSRGTLNRIEKVVSISGLHDLRPLRKTRMNEMFKMTESDAAAESPALKKTAVDCPVVAWVGGAELPEFLRQARLLAEAWSSASYHEDPGLHHYNVIDGLKKNRSDLCSALLDI